MSGTPRGRQLYAIMADGEAVPNEVINDLLAEAMVKKADSKVSEMKSIGPILDEKYELYTARAPHFTSKCQSWFREVPISFSASSVAYSRRNCQKYVILALPKSDKIALIVVKTL